MDITLKVASKLDMELVNDTYRSIDFKESYFESEIIVMASHGDNFVGLGRLQKIDEKSLEMGGIYVNESLRGKGVASKIVSKLVELSSEYESVYCIPFEHLEKFYKGFGFDEVLEKTDVPKSVVDKYNWCNDFYEAKTLLLIKTN